MNTPSLFDGMLAIYPRPLIHLTPCQNPVVRNQWHGEAPKEVLSVSIWPSVGFQLGKRAFRTATARSFEATEVPQRMAHGIPRKCNPETKLPSDCITAVASDE